jgi:hypothetical protein
MGQSVTVRTSRSADHRVVRFEINRSLTGMGHERYRSLDDIVDDRPVDVLARRLFEQGGVDSIHVNSSVITVRLAGGSTGEGLEAVVQNLFRFYDPNAVAAPAAGAAEAPVPEGEAEAATGEELAPEGAPAASEEAVAAADATDADEAPDHEAAAPVADAGPSEAEGIADEAPTTPEPDEEPGGLAEVASQPEVGEPGGEAPPAG